MKGIITMTLILGVFLGAFFGSMLFASGGIQTSYGKDTRIEKLDIVLPQNIINNLQSHPLILDIYIHNQVGITEIIINRTGTNQYRQVIKRIDQIYNYVLNAQSGLLENQLGNLNCRPVVNVNINVSSRIIYNQSTQTFNERWFVNPNCNGVGN